MSKSEKTEKQFRSHARDAGLGVEDPKIIRSPYPVEDKRGETKKVVTLPDSFVTDPNSNQCAHVEVTNGGGNTPHKQAQLRVTEAAGVDNYFQLSGDQIEALENLTPDEKYQLLAEYFNWVQSE